MNFSFHRTDLHWARAMGFTGAQIDDDDGVSVGKSIALHYIIALRCGLIVSNLKLKGTTAKPTFEYKYLGGRCRHYKLVGKMFKTVI